MAGNTVFDKILRRELPAKIRYENEYVLAFDDLRPRAPTHIQIIPKKAITSLTAIQSPEDEKYLLEIFKAVQVIVQKYDLTGGYYIRINDGHYRVVPYLHVHLMSELKRLPPE